MAVLNYYMFMWWGKTVRLKPWFYSVCTLNSHPDIWLCWNQSGCISEGWRWIYPAIFMFPVDGPGQKHTPKHQIGFPDETPSWNALQEKGVNYKLQEQLPTPISPKCSQYMSVMTFAMIYFCHFKEIMTNLLFPLC